MCGILDLRRYTVTEGKLSFTFRMRNDEAVSNPTMPAHDDKWERREEGGGRREERGGRREEPGMREEIGGTPL